MSYIRDLYRDISSEDFLIFQGHYINPLDISNPHEYAHNVTKYSILPLPV